MRLRIRSLPAARQRRTVKVHEQAIRRGILEDVVVVRDHRLPVAAEEVDLHARDAQIAQTRELGDARFVGQHSVARRLRRGVPVARRVVPEEDVDVLGARVGDELGDLLVADLLVPQRVDETVAPAHLGRVVDEATLHVERRGAVAHERPAPRGLAGNDRRIGADTCRIGDVDAEHRFGDRAQRADDDHAPRRAPRKRRARVDRAAVHSLARIRESDRVFAIRRVGAQARTRVVATETGLADEQPGVAGSEERGIHPAGAGWRSAADDVHL